MPLTRRGAREVSGYIELESGQRFAIERALVIQTGTWEGSGQGTLTVQVGDSELPQPGQSVRLVLEGVQAEMLVVMAVDGRTVHFRYQRPKRAPRRH